MNPVELATRDAVVDLIPAHPQRQQLSTRDDSVLPSCDLGHRRIDRRAFCGYMPH
jgi:hypothetical protein